MVTSESEKLMLYRMYTYDVHVQYMMLYTSVLITQTTTYEETQKLELKFY